ncbi:helix-turn-helix domain-containing protein [Streptomyces longwoodensis]|uniref:helix-turn-helix domain-containing protein n=1 Tax=Streptomyces longwoodensis TaxID=68231 RepID=UPI003408E270
MPVLAAQQPVTAAAATTQPNRSARAFGRVLRALARMGADLEHQVADVAHSAGLRPGHASRLLLTAVEEGFAEPGERYGTYRLTCDAAVLLGPAPIRTSTPEITETLRALHRDTNLATAWHVPGWRPGAGLHLDLVDVVSPRLALRFDAAQQDRDLSRTAAGRIALAFLPPQMTSTADGRPLRLCEDLTRTVTSSRIAASRTTSTQSLATAVLRGDALVATLTVTGTPDQFTDDLIVQEHAVLLRRAAARSSQSRAA